MAKVLIIEDENALITLYSEVLEAEGHVVSKAEDGDLGFQLAVAGDWDVLFLDIMLPNMDGIEILRKIKEAGVLEGKKVYMLSNLDNPSVINEAVSLGAVGHLNKAESNPGMLIDLVSQAIA